MSTRDLGVVSGPILVFGGVYSNLHALEALIRAADGLDIAPERMICTGDIVAYCADARASLDRMIELGCPVLAGNCEVQLAENAQDCGCGYDEGSICNRLSRDWYEHAQSQVTQDHRNWMAALPERIVFEHAGKRFGVVHGGASDISRFVWPVSDDVVVLSEAELLERQISPVDHILAGHSGIPMDRRVGKWRWTNAGAIGMPAHDGVADTSFAVINGDDVTFHRLRYEAQGAADAMRAVGLTQGYEVTLLSGYWPSEDTLPQIMRLGKDAKELALSP